MLSQVQVIHGHQSQLRNLVKRNITVGLHTFIHDGSIATYDRDTKEFKYLKFERLSGKKEQAHNDLSSWVKYLNHLGYSLDDNLNIFLVDSWRIIEQLGGQKIPKFDDLTLVDHHVAHHFSTNHFNSLVMDKSGSQQDILTVFKKNNEKQKLRMNNNVSLAYTLQSLWEIWFIEKEDSLKKEKHNWAGHCMALAGFGKDYSSKIGRQSFRKYTEELEEFCSKFPEVSYVDNCNNYVTSLHFHWYKKIRNILKRHFNKNDKICASGGQTENIILNTLLKNDFPKYEPTPHCGDEGTSIGALIYGLRIMWKSKVTFNLNNLHQHDENFGYASQKTIKKVAKLLYDGKLVMWGQGWGEVGPRALGFRSILMNPCVPNAKEIINDKVKKRVWFRPYGASVPTDSYKKYFDFGYESPWMLYQAKVKDPKKFKNITHADGTCRIQTVDKKHNPTFLRLLKEFEKLSGYPVLINTSLNIPGKPIVGTKKQAIFMFDNSQADVLVIGDSVYTK